MFYSLLRNDPFIQVGVKLGFKGENDLAKNTLEHEFTHLSLGYKLLRNGIVTQ